MNTPKLIITLTDYFNNYGTLQDVLNIVGCSDNYTIQVIKDGKVDIDNMNIADGDDWTADDYMQHIVAKTIRKLN